MLIYCDIATSNATCLFSIRKLESAKERLVRIAEISSKYRVSDYLSASLSDTSVVVNNWAHQVMRVREENIKILYHWSDQYGIDREVVSVAANIIDRCLSHRVPEVRNGTKMPYELDLCSMTAYFLAIKARDDIRRIPRISTLLPQYYSTELLDSVEVEILREMQWDLIYPTPTSIMKDLLSLLPSHFGSGAFPNYLGEVQRKAEHLIQLATLSYRCITFSPMTIALVAVMDSIQSIDHSLLLKGDHFQQFKVAVTNHLGDAGITCDTKDVHECSVRISQLQKPFSVASNNTVRPVTP